MPFVELLVDNAGKHLLLKNKKIFHKNFATKKFKLGQHLNKNEWCFMNVKNIEYLQAVKIMLIDWELYENGWLINSYHNIMLFNYVCNISSKKPIALTYLK